MTTVHGIGKNDRFSFKQNVRESPGNKRLNSYLSVGRGVDPTTLKQSDKVSNRIAELSERKSLTATSEEFIEVAYEVRRAIFHYLQQRVQFREPMGFSLSTESLESESPLRPVVRAMRLLTRSLEGAQFEAEENSLLAEVLPHIREQVRTVQRYISSGLPLDLDEKEIEPFAYELLDLRSLLTVTALEIKGREINNFLEEEVKSGKLERNKNGQEILVVQESKRLFREIIRHRELHSEVLPKIQEHVGVVVQTLLPFLSELRERAPAPFGFFSETLIVRGAPLEVKPLALMLKASAASLEKLFEGLNEETGSDMTYRSVINGLIHYMDHFRVALMRQHFDGIIAEKKTGMVESQSEKAFQELTQGLRYLNQIGKEEVSALGEQGVV